LPLGQLFKKLTLSAKHVAFETVNAGNQLLNHNDLSNLRVSDKPTFSRSNRLTCRN
jgi:hypothetical protein